MPIMPTLIVHGGAGSIPYSRQQAHLDGVEKAARIGLSLLRAGISALDVVEQTIWLLEDDPTFNAGRGSPLTRDGHIENDAMIMDGATLKSGAVASISGFRHPISGARLVMEHTSHRLMVGQGAVNLLQNYLLEEVNENWQVTPYQREVWNRRQAGEEINDTVGVVALDVAGNVAAGTSTGGTAFKLPGRVGDAPLIGAGTFADTQCGGASATGEGEDLMAIQAAKTACDLMRTGLSAQQSAEETIRRLADPRIKGLGGIITVDMTGRVGFSHNTPCMSRAYVNADGSISCGILQPS